MKTAEEALKGFGFEYWRAQPGLDDFNLVSYVKGRVVVEVNQWRDDWDVSRAYGPREDLAAARPALDELRKLTPARQKRIAFLIREANETMKTVPSGTVVGYDVVSGKKLFTEKNRATRFPDQTDALPQANDLYHTLNGKTYRVVAVRKGSTETLCEMDVREEASQ